MRGFVVALTLAGSLALPVLAQAMEDMSCADFSAMDAQGQMDTIASMEGDDMMAAGGGMAAGDSMADEEMTKGVAMACSEHPEMMLGEAMKGAMGH